MIFSLRREPPLLVMMEVAGNGELGSGEAGIGWYVGSGGYGNADEGDSRFKMTTLIMVVVLVVKETGDGHGRV